MIYKERLLLIDDQEVIVFWESGIARISSTTNKYDSSSTSVIIELQYSLGEKSQITSGIINKVVVVSVVVVVVSVIDVVVDVVVAVDADDAILDGADVGWVLVIVVVVVVVMVDVISEVTIGVVVVVVGWVIIADVAAFVVVGTSICTTSNSSNPK